MRAARTGFDSWRASWAPRGDREVELAVAQVRAFVETERARFADFECSTTEPIPRCAGYWRGPGDTREYVIFPAVWKNEVCRGRNPRDVGAALVERGLIERDAAGKFSVYRQPRSTARSARYYVVSGRIVGDDDAD